MSYYRDLRDYLTELEARGKLARIRGPINKDTQLYPLVRLQFRGLPEEERKAFLFENVIDSRGKKYPGQVAIGVLAVSTEMYAIGLKCRVEEIPERLGRAEESPVPPVLVPSGPVQEEVHAGAGLLEHGGLGEFPIPIGTPGFDPAPYITAPYWVTRDPDTGITNVGMYRAMVKSPTRTGLNFATPNKGGYAHLLKYRERGKPMPAAIVIGGPPSIGYAAVTPLPADINELAVAGAIASQPVEMVRCKTVDIEVPASAEIVIEGEVSISETEPEAPFGEANGFVGLQDMNPFFNVTCITHRRYPIWQATLSQYPPSESSKIREIGNRSAVYRHLRYTLKMEHVLDVAFHDTIGSARLMAIKVAKVESAVIRQTLEAAARRFPLAKFLIAADPDVNIHDLDSLIMSVLERTQPHRDCHIQTLPAPTLGDYSLEPLEKLEKRMPTDPERPQASRLFIDATAKWPYPPISLPRREFMEEAVRLWEREGLPPLKLRAPVSGVELGFWSEEHAGHARAAVQGDYFKAGDDYSKRRRKW